MQRALPWSIAIHGLMLAIVVIFGARIAAVPVPMQRVINVRLTELPQERTRPADPAPPVEEIVETPPEVEQPKPKPADPVPAEPKQKPEAPAEQPKPKPEQRDPELEPQVQQLSAAPTGETTEKAISATTDQPFPFTYYLDLVEGRISRQWQPRQMGDRRSCVVHFFIERDGSITRATIARASGIDLFDREALRAVQAAHPLPALPARFTSRNLGVTYIFTLESGL